jgi:alpha-tubulin suppressor-like RCC1 family protein
LGVALNLGCGAPERTTGAGSGTDEGSTTEVTAQLTAVPTGTQCVRITVTPPSGTASIQSFTLTAGASTASLSLGSLPVGNDAVTGAAYAATCTGIGSSAPTYTADPVTALVRSGVVTTVALTFRPNNPASVSVNFVTNVLSIAAGGYNSFALTSAAPLEWGQAAFNDVPVALPGPATAVTAIAAGAYHACALHADGTVWCWGTSYYGGAGPGIAVGGGSSTPVQVPLTGAFTMIAAGLYHTCAYRPGPANNSSAQAVFCWGYNGDGELGNGTTVNSATPVQVSGITGISFNGAAIRSLGAGAFHSLATMGDGRFLAWGSNNVGQLGDGTTTNRTTATYSYADSSEIAIAGGSAHTCALHANGSVWCWGQNVVGEGGDGTTTNHLTPTAVVGLPGPAKQLAIGADHSCALLTSGQVACWGYNAEGEIGDLTTTNRLTPVVVNLGNDVVQSIGAGYNHTCVLTAALGIWCWGYNGFGEIGDGTNNDAFGPTKVLLQ